MRTLAALTIALLPRSVSANDCDKYLDERHQALLLEANAFLGRPDTSREAARAFFNALPESFDCYKALFDDPGPLAEAPAMDEVFPKLRTAVAERSYIRKLVRLSVGAAWQEGQIGALQHAARVALTDSPSAFVRELETLRESQEAGVWDFLFGRPDPASEPLSAGLQQRVCSLSARSCESSKQAHARALVRQRSGHQDEK
jgi:hypothetical protein